MYKFQTHQNFINKGYFFLSSKEIWVVYKKCPNFFKLKTKNILIFRKSNKLKKKMFENYIIYSN